MIARLTGELAESSCTACVIDAGGVGYDVSIPLSTFDKLPHPGERVRLYIHTQVREDAITLFGFATQEERELFRYLINVSGIGGKLALSVLSTMPVSAFCAAIATNDIKAISRINGIGKRTAERLVVELRDKLSAAGTGTVFAASGANILTINQSIPTNGCAAVTISAETSEMEESLEQLLADVAGLDGVVKLEILAG